MMPSGLVPAALLEAIIQLDFKRRRAIASLEHGAEDIRLKALILRLLHHLDDELRHAFLSDAVAPSGIAVSCALLREGFLGFAHCVGELAMTRLRFDGRGADATTISRGRKTARTNMKSVS